MSPPSNRSTAESDATAFRQPLCGWLVRLLCLSIVCGGFCGCVNRRMTIHTDPPGAHVLLEGREIGFTPVSVDFTYDATREFTFEKDGFSTLTVLQSVQSPWYLRPPFDFFTENFLPFQMTARHEFMYKLQPQVVVPTQELINRANTLRSESQTAPWGHSYP
jgi:hypothetical protein